MFKCEVGFYLFGISILAKNQNKFGFAGDLSIFYLSYLWFVIVSLIAWGFKSILEQIRTGRSF